MEKTDHVTGKYNQYLAIAREAKRWLNIRNGSFEQLANALESARAEYKKLSPVQRLTVEEPPNDKYGAHWR